MTALPQGYRRASSLSILQSRFMSALALALLFALLALGVLIAPRERETVYALDAIGWSVGLAVSLASYMLLHEMIHGACMRAFSGVKPRYSFHAVYASAGSEAFFPRGQYAVVALAPFLLLGALLLALNASLYPRLFWLFYIVQMPNVSGSAGDLIVVLWLTRMPRGTLVRDSGTEISFYVKA